MILRSTLLFIFLFLASFSYAENKKANWISITLSGEIKDNVQMSYFMGQRENSLRNLISTVEKAKRDSKIQGIAIYLRTPRMGLAKIEELRMALVDFQRRGKKVYAYSETLTKSDYLLASAADKLYISPQGGVDLSGIAIELVFIKNTLDMLGVKANFHQVGNYKSASEIYTRSEASKYQKDSINFLLDGLYAEFVKVISKNRKFTKNEVKNIIDTGFFSAKEAKEARLIDGYSYENEFNDLIKKDGQLVQQNQNTSNAKANNMNIMQFFTMLSQKPKKLSKAPKIALIYMEGAIISGKSTKGLFSNAETIGAEDYIYLLRKIRKNPQIKAVVLRINSPGGSALASDILWNEILLTSKEKPVIASLSDMAASGGYYIAMACPTIVANATTITGSIGVVGGKFNLKGLYDKLGIHKEVFKRGEHADLFTDYRDFSEKEKALIEKQMLETYEVFVSKASKGRKIPVEQMYEHAQGKVYTGVQAKKVGLVDEIGGLAHAIKLARKQAKDNAYNLEVVVYPEQRSLLELFQSNLMTQKQMMSEFKEIEHLLHPLVIYFKNVKQIFSKEKVATLTPFYLNYLY